ncbi:MAG: DUF1492 domain-containing protein [Clostridia bacterium]|nr:DUF1492 domain-containing protein [Clostridia bacterium]
MKAKEYLGQAYLLDQRINSQLEQLTALNDLATKCTSTISDMPRNPNRAGSRMADTVSKIVDLQEEINRDVDELVDLKMEIIGVIRSVEKKEYRVLLELRYLCFKSWEDIAAEMNYSVRWVHIMISRALAAVDRILES